MVHQIVKKKRRGRPPLTTTDRTSPSPAVDRRSSGRRRRNVRYNFDIDDYVDDDEFVVDDEFVIHDDVITRKETNHHHHHSNSGGKKKMRLTSENDRRVETHAPDDGFRKRVSHALHAPEYDDDEESEGEDERLKRRRVDDYDEVDDEIRGRNLREYDFDDDDGGGEEEAGGSDYDRGMESDGPKEMERMPDKKTLEFILDKLQKKDIYGVYARPVDPEELPDYYDVIKRPMDFATVRRKLAKGSYLTLKEFESDVLLICSNAMQYNAPDTIYYKQASSIQEQAKLRFQRLRTNVDRSEIEPKSEQRTVPSFSLPKKQLKKSVSLNERKPDPEPEPEPFCAETLSGANVRTEEFPNSSPTQSPVRHNSPARQNSGEMPVNDSSSLGDNNLDKDQELLPVPTPKVDLEGSQGKGVMPKLGRKPSINEEDRRATYNISVQPATDSDSVLSTFEGESKQFIPVGLHADLAYARSLARFAATLGSVAWKVASQTIEQALPEGVKYGRGWVGEYEPLPTIPENRILKVPNFLALFNVTSDVQDNEKGSRLCCTETPKGWSTPYQKRNGDGNAIGDGMGTFPGRFPKFGDVIDRLDKSRDVS